ncbi:hypothetical protein K439DRAFT_1633556, partial [Ramaria rubella]
MTTRVFRAIPVIYVDKKVIVVSKPPGVISQTRRYPDETENKPASFFRRYDCGALMFTGEDDYILTCII